jgi:iron complex transport system substrate-binding protein
MRLLSLAPSSTEIVCALGAGEQLVGVTRYCDWPAEVASLPKVGGWTDVDDRMVAALRPDLILTSTFVQQEAEQRFAALNLPVLHVDPRTLGEVADSFHSIGEAIGRGAAARDLADRFQAGLEVAAATAATGHRVYVEEWHQPPTPSGNWVPEMIARAGGVCPLLRPGERSRPVAEEAILAFDPELVVLSLCGLGEQVKAGIVGARPSWKQLTAVRWDQVHVIDDSLLNRPGPRLVEGLALLTKLIAGLSQA